MLLHKTLRTEPYRQTSSWVRAEPPAGFFLTKLFNLELLFIHDVTYQSNLGKSPIASSIVTKLCGAVPGIVRIGSTKSPFVNSILSASARGKSWVGCGSSGRGWPCTAAIMKKRTRVWGVP